jgi:hypothetical protein
MTEKQKYKFCTTDDPDGDKAPLESDEYDTTNVSKVTALRHKGTGKLYIVSTYEKYYNIADKTSVVFDGDEVIHYKRQEVTIRASDRDVKRGIRYVLDMARGGKEDFEVVILRALGGITEIPIMSSYCGEGIYRSYYGGLFDVPREYQAKFEEPEVVSSHEWEEIRREARDDYLNNSGKIEIEVI